MPKKKPVVFKERAAENPESKKEKASGYTAADIYVLEGLEPVRKRPAMYIGSTGSDGLHHLIWEVYDNSADEAMAGRCKNIEVVLLPNSRVKVADDGAGIPVETHPQTKKSALETVITTLHAGAKFGSKAYQISGGLHGVGVSVVCALSKWMRAEVCRNGFRYAQEYAKGKVKTKVEKIGTCNKTGTTIFFEPDEGIFGEVKFDLKKITDHLRHQAYLTKSTRITIADERTEEKKHYTFYFEGGLCSYIKYLTRGVTPVQQMIFYGIGQKDEIIVEAAFRYTEEYECFEESFANNIITSEGGSHLTGFRTALTRTFNDYAHKEGLLKEKDENLTGEDIREGFTGVVSVKIKNPQFEGQTKAKLGNPEAKPAVESVVSETLIDYLERNPQEARAVIEKCFLVAKARKAAKAARETVLRKGILGGLTLPGKLADCASRNPEESELFLVEGESAGGCFFGDTKVVLADGRNISFEQIVKENNEGKKNYCYTIKEDGSVGIAPITNPRKTKENAEVVKIILDNGEEIICTPGHKFMLRGGTYKLAKDLTVTDSLMPLYRKLSHREGRITIEGYEMVFDPSNNNWIFTHLLSDKYNLEKGVYGEKSGSNRHHIDFNKLNNNPDNIERRTRKEHMNYHRKMVRMSLLSESGKEKSRQAHKSADYREKVRRIMTTPEMRRLLSARASKQWENEEYKQYMMHKYLEFYRTNKDYWEKDVKLLYEGQKKYWSNPDNRKQWAERVRNYFIEHPDKKKELSLQAKKQWQNPELLEWRRQKTKEQWTNEFRLKRKVAYNKTYMRRALSLMKEVFARDGKFSNESYEKERLKRNDKNILRYETISQRFFNGSEKQMLEAVKNYNHRIKKIVKLNEKMDVYDLEVEGTHNFALASGVFVHNSGKQARNRHFQAILPLRGKILNVERARLDKLLESKEIRSLIIALGTAIADDFDLTKLRYHRVILMTDADVDGAHIRTLLLTLFYRYLRPIIENGHLYIAQPPLYRIQAGKRVEFAYTDEDKEEILSSMKGAAGINIQRYKGLGEMNPEQLWETTMNPENRVLLKVAMEDAEAADKIFDILMGKEVMPRKRFIQAHAKSVKNLDV